MTIFTEEDLNHLIDIELDGIDTNDYPDFCDAYLANAYWPNGLQLSDKEIDDINDNHRDWIYDKVIEHLF